MRLLKILMIPFLSILSLSITIQAAWSDTIELVSISTDGEQGDDYSYYGAAISADGRFVAFHSSATTLVPGDTNGESDIFVHDRQTGQTTRVSVNSDGEQAKCDVGSSGIWPSISADGRFVAFESEPTILCRAIPMVRWTFSFMIVKPDKRPRVSVNSDGEIMKVKIVNLVYSLQYPPMAASLPFLTLTSNATSSATNTTIMVKMGRLRGYICNQDVSCMIVKPGKRPESV